MRVLASEKYGALQRGSDAVDCATLKLLGGEQCARLSAPGAKDAVRISGEHHAPHQLQRHHWHRLLRRRLQLEELGVRVCAPDVDAPALSAAVQPGAVGLVLHSQHRRLVGQLHEGRRGSAGRAALPRGTGAPGGKHRLARGRTVRVTSTCSLRHISSVAGVEPTGSSSWSGRAATVPRPRASASSPAGGGTRSWPRTWRPRARPAKSRRPRRTP